MFRALNRNQITILSVVSKNSFHSITSLLLWIEKTHNIPISTLKLNAKILRELGLLEFGQGRVASLTSFGKIVVDILFSDKKHTKKNETCKRMKFAEPMPKYTMKSVYNI